MKRKFPVDFQSLNFKLWAYFALFAVVLMLVLWFLQVLFLSTYYQEMKIRETTRVASAIQKEYDKTGISDEFRNTLYDISTTNDLFIQVETHDRVIISPSTPEKWHPSDAYMEEMLRVKVTLLKSGEHETSTIIPEPRTETNTLAYASYLEKTPGNQIIMYIFTPLYPVSSTVAILQRQLIYIMIISLFLAFALSFYLSHRITRPIRSITNSAKMLAEGKYGIAFQGGRYTEISNLADTLTYTSTRLQKSDTLQKDLMANVSHDLRTPLTMVKSYAEMIRDLSGDNPEKRNAHLQVIIEEADRLNVLVGDMLTLSHFQSGAFPLQKTTFSIKETVESLLSSYGIFTEQEGYTLLLDCDANLTWYADKAKIKQVLSNLLNNAIKYCGQDKLIIISVFKKAGKIRCEVADHGMGIAPEEIESIWERYYKASTNHVRSAGGTGLGLSIVKEILLLHGASFGVDSEPGKGSLFWFEL